MQCKCRWCTSISVGKSEAAAPQWCVTTETWHFLARHGRQGDRGACVSSRDVAFQHSNGWQEDQLVPTTRGHVETSRYRHTRVKAKIGLMRSALAGVHCDQREVRDSTLLRKRSPCCRWSGRVGRCHTAQCRGQGPRPATTNHPRTYNARAEGNHPSSLIVGQARLPSRLYLTICLCCPPRGSR